MAMKEMRWAATILDISQGGVRIKLQRRFEKGTGLAIELPGDDQRESSVVFVKVVRVSAQDDGAWALGCKFVSELSDDEVQRLMLSEQFVLGSSKEQYDSHADDIDERDGEPAPRPEPPAAAPALEILTEVGVEIEIGQERPIRCWIKRLDVSKCWPLAAGTLLNIGGKARDGTAWTIKIDVIALRQQGERWHLRGRLAQPAVASGLLRVLGRLEPKRS
jgi:PilZ domain